MVRFDASVSVPACSANARKGYWVPLFKTATSLADEESTTVISDGLTPTSGSRPVEYDRSEFVIRADVVEVAN
jgi:hypothetical protein